MAASATDPNAALKMKVVRSSLGVRRRRSTADATAFRPAESMGHGSRRGKVSAHERVHAVDGGLVGANL